MTIKKLIKQKLTLRVFPNLPVTKRPPEQPLGKGKSNVSYWVTPVKPGTIVFELTGNYKTALKAAAFKLSVKSRVFQSADWIAK